MLAKFRQNLWGKYVFQVSRTQKEKSFVVQAISCRLNEVWSSDWVMVLTFQIPRANILISDRTVNYSFRVCGKIKLDSFGSDMTLVRNKEMERLGATSSWWLCCHLKAINGWKQESISIVSWERTKHSACKNRLQISLRAPPAGSLLRTG